MNIQKFLSILSFRTYFKEKKREHSLSINNENNPEYEKVITQSTYPQEYGQYKQVLKNLLFTTQDSTLFNKLKENSISLELEAPLWLEAFIIRSQTTKKGFDEFKFAMDDSSVSLDNQKFTAKHIESFVINFVNIVLDDTVKFVDDETFLWAIEFLQENGRICMRREDETPYIKSMEFIQEQIKRAINKSSSKEDYNATEMGIFEGMESFISDLSAKAQTSNINEIIENNKIMAGKKFSISNSSNKKKTNTNHWMQICIKFRKECAILDDTEVQKATIECLQKVEKIATSNFNFSAIEKLEISNAIEKDLPALLSNYSSLPINFRNNLIDKDTGQSVKHIVIQSIDNITAQLGVIYCNHETNNNDNSVKEIQKTAKYLLMKK